LSGLSGENAGRGLPVRLKAAVTFYDHERRILYLQDADEGALVRFPTAKENEDFWAQPGDLVEVEGTTSPGRTKAAIRAKSSRVVGQTKLPVAVELDPQKSLNSQLESRLVRVKGWIPTVAGSGSRLTFNLVLGPGRTVEVILNGGDSPKVNDLPGALVELTGVFTLKFDAAGQANGARVYVQNTEFVHKLSTLKVSPISDARSTVGSEPFRVRGTVVNHTLGQFLIVRDSSGSMRFPYPALNYFNSGSVVEVFAFPLEQKPVLVLTNVIVKSVSSDTSTQEAVAAVITPTAPNTNLTAISSVTQIRKLSPQEASRGYPVDITGFAPFFDSSAYMQFVQDDTSGIYLDISRMDTPPVVHAGQKIRVRGFTGPGNFAPIVMCQSLQLLAGNGYPSAEPVSFRKLMSGTFDSQWVALKGVVRDQWLTTNSSSIALFAGDGVVRASLPVLPQRLRSTNLVDASIEIRGVCRTLFDERRRLQGVELLVPDWDQVTVHVSASPDPFTLPVKAVNELFQFHAGAEEIHRVRLMGAVTYRSLDGSFYMQDASGAIQVQPRQAIADLEVGKLVDVAGFPVIVDKIAVLQEALGHTENDPATLEPVDLKAEVGVEAPQQASLVRIKAQILGCFPHGSEELLTVRFGDRIIDVILEKESERSQLSGIEPGAVANLTGVCLAQSDSAGNLQSFRLLLRSPNDVVIISRPTWWTARRTLWALGAVAAVLLLALGWVRALRRQVRQRTHELHAEIEQHKRTEVHLESEIAERRRMETEVERTHQELIIASRQAGMAEVATSVLHNVGNVLNSVNVSTGVIADKISNSKLNNIARVAEMFQSHSENLAKFLEQDVKGRQLPQYLGRLADHLKTEQTILLSELDSLRMNVEHIKGIVGMQQSYAKVFGSTEAVKPTDLVEDALRMNSGSLERHEVRVVRDYQPDLPQVVVDKHKMLQILVNLICNAKKACDESRFPERLLTVRVSADEQKLQIAVVDNGVGIPRDNLTRIFNHGFTTRKDGHGFGLHSGALAAKEMGGALLAHSEGPGKGAQFTLSIPLSQKPGLETADTAAANHAQTAAAS
jgi:signal transduction histidine kinase